MKKFFFILMVAALALPMMGQTKADATQTVRHTTNHPAKASFTKHVAFDGIRADVPEGYASITLSVGDVWGDGSGYQMLLDADATAYGTIIPETGPIANPAIRTGTSLKSSS